MAPLPNEYSGSLRYVGEVRQHDLRTLVLGIMYLLSRSRFEY